MDEELKRLYVAGLSGSQIAAEMRRGLSRNAIIGRIHRTGLNGNTERQRQPTTREGREQRRVEREARKNERRKWQRQQFRIDNPRPTIQETQLRCVEIAPRNLSLVDLEPNDCRYPYGDSPFAFCGHPKFAGSSYCVAHHFLTIGPGTSSERAANRVPTRFLEAAE
jgi:GcrA cell cycle regulator